MDSAVEGYRFGHSDENGLNQLLKDKDAQNNKKATKAAMSVFLQYLLSENRDVIDFETADELNAVLYMEIDIIKDIRFKRANDTFRAVTIQLKRQDLGKTDHTPSLDEDAVGKSYGSVALNTDTPCGLFQNVWFDIMRYLCICAEGAEKISEV
ncbi:unnamed protein product [Mytilus coruscus]|uniref:Uncharacterized protein n=1 Tax=Mytilus coruscus TaxID=42192 RepID=A0A6J8BXK0_MYTCO|nr:unnamed protein product [Mytilus coruscus]